MPKAGSIKDLRREEETLPDPAPDEVTVQVQAIGLNFADIFAMQGLYGATPQGAFIPGLEFSGKIIRVGAEVPDRKVGERVMGATKFGGYVSHLNSHHRYVTPIPADWSYAEGAGFLVQGLTAYYGLVRLGDLQPGMTVLIHSAAGGVGILANRICQKFGASTIGTVGSAHKVAYLEEEEAYGQIIVRGKDFAERLQSALAGRELRLVMECIGGKIFRQSWEALAPMGRLIAYGSASFTSHSAKPNYFKLIPRYLMRPKIDPLRLPSENKSLMGFNLIWLYERTDLMNSMLQDLMDLKLKPQHIGHQYSFAELPEAVRFFQKGENIGKIVVLGPSLPD
ncbi:medium chain dehydrogenase/reductase family protein [soil metagenome]